MDYWYELDLCEHENWEAFKKSPQRPERLWMFTTKARQSFWEISYQDGDGFLFGRETSGCPPWLHEELGESARLTIPQPNTRARSLNISNSVSVAVYEALRQKNL